MARWISCTTCEGGGEVPCEACEGTGANLGDEETLLAEIEPDAIECGECLGFGVEPCEECGGTGGYYAE